MSADDVVLALTVLMALGFDFTNGFHDTANAVATSIATGAMRPRAAVLMAGALNFVGALLSLSVAATIAKGIVNTGSVTLTVVFCGLVGAIMWNLVTWYLGFPSSSSHALIGGVVGAAFIAGGVNAIQVHGLVSKVIVPGVLAPVAAAGIAGIATLAVYVLIRGVRTQVREAGFKIGQIGSASLLALAHGTNDAQKTMGVITLALIANGTISPNAGIPEWVVLSCALAIAIGTATGGFRIIRTVGHRLTHIETPQGFASSTSATAVILASTHFGYPLSTTQVVTGSVVGSGVGRRVAGVHWGVAGRVVTAWVITLPSAALVGALAWRLATAIGGSAGVLVVFALSILAAGLIFRAARKAPVNASNVNAPETADRPLPDAREPYANV
ncbi:MAG TPA: inorganic phosphate transporter [Actinomycetes bacterium]|nr:inorganic phosphate transporter [Actinomycetes bacterium]